MNQNEASVIKDINEKGGPVAALAALFILRKQSLALSIAKRAATGGVVLVVAKLLPLW